jgi:acid phosphatase (class A)
MRFMAISKNVVLAFIAASAVTVTSASSHPHAQQGNYLLSSEDADLTKLLTPLPTPDSAAQQRNMAAMLAVRRKRTFEEGAANIASPQKSVFRFSDVLGARFSERYLPKTAALFKAVNSDAAMITLSAKTYFRRARPFVVSSDAHPIVPSGKKAYYPFDVSGHATTDYLDAFLLARMVPEKRAELFARGRQFGRNRVVDDMHYPSGKEAGRLDAAIIAAALVRNPMFSADFNAARDELRSALGLQ